MKKTLLATIIIAASLLPLASLAADPAVLSTTAGPTTTPTPTPLVSLSQAAQATRLATLKTRGDAEITRRLTNLQSAQINIDADTKLTGTDKTTLDGQLTSEVNGLTQLKSTLDAETTLAGARTDVQNIFLDYRVYALMLPKARLVATADTESTALRKLQTYEGLLAAKVSSTNTSLVDMQAKLQAASTSLNGFVTALINLQPSDYNSDHTLLVGKRATLVQVRTDLGAAQADAQAMRQSIK